MLRRTFPILVVVFLLAACVSFRSGPFAPLFGPFVGAVQVKEYERQRTLKSDLRAELGDPATISEHDNLEQWTYVSVRRRMGVERRGFTEKVTCQIVRDTHVFSFENERVSSVVTSSEAWQVSGKDNPECVEP